MAATKVMKFWAVCLAVLGKLLASLGVSAAASAARRDAALYERTLGNESAGTEAPGPEVPKAVGCGAPDRGPGAGSPSVPAPRGVPLYGSARRRFPRPELPPTIKQRILAEAHGTSPGMRSRRTYTAAPLTADECSDQGGNATATTTATASTADSEARAAVIPAARNRAHTAGVI